MKKILVVLLVLAVATGVFAQEGDWVLSGQAIVGARLDFDPDPSGVADPDPALIWGSDYWYPYDGWADAFGKFSLAYTGFQGLSVGLSFAWWDGFQADVNYEGENFKFQTKANMLETFNKKDGRVERLWGSYSFLDNIVNLEAAFNSRETEFWTSDKTATFLNWSGDGNGWIPWGDYAVRPWFRTGDTFTKVDHASMVVIDVALQGLSFGLQAKGFANGLITGSRGPDVSTELVPVDENDPYGPQKKKETIKARNDLVEDVLKKMVFGFKFEMSPIEVAAQFLMENYGVYIGGKWFVGPVTVGVSFNGLLAKTDTSYQHIKAGVDVNYSQDAFSAGIRGYYDIEDANKAGTDYESRIGFEPRFCYNVIPTHLAFGVDAGFYFVNSYLDSKKQDNLSSIIWALQPQLWWNFLGTGAVGPGGYWSFGTGIILRYRIVKEEVNALDVVFKWEF